MRSLVILLTSLTLAPLAHADAKTDIKAMRQKVQRGFSSAALARFDHGLRITMPPGAERELNISYGGDHRVMLMNGQLRSTVYTVSREDGSEQTQGARISFYGGTTIMRKPIAMLAENELVLADTVSHLNERGSKTESVVYKERSIIGPFLRVQSTTRFAPHVDGKGEISPRISSDVRRLVIAGIPIPLPGRGKKIIAAMYAQSTR